SIRDIARESGYTNPALYKHFASKEELAVHLFETCHQRLWTRCNAAIEAATSFDAKLEGYVGQNLQLVDEDPEAMAFLSERACPLAQSGPVGPAPHDDQFGSRPDEPRAATASRRATGQPGCRGREPAGNARRACPDVAGRRRPGACDAVEGGPRRVVPKGVRVIFFAPRVSTR